MACKRCGSEQIVRNGFRNQRQCYLCRGCGHQFISVSGRHTSLEETTALLLYCLGLSYTAIAQILLVHPSTIMRWVRKYTRPKCKNPIPQGDIIVELDAMWHFVRESKYEFGKLIVAQPNSSSTGKLDTEAASPFDD